MSNPHSVSGTVNLKEICPDISCHSCGNKIDRGIPFHGVVEFFYDGTKEERHYCNNCIIKAETDFMVVK